MVTENQITLDKLMTAVSARKTLHTTTDLLNTFRHSVDDVKMDLKTLDALDPKTKEKFLEIDAQLYEMTKFLSDVDNAIHLKKFLYEQGLFKALGDVE